MDPKDILLIQSRHTNFEEIKFVREDAFIEKAADKLKQLMYEQHLFEGRIHRNAVIDNFVEYFKNYLKGE